MEFNSIESGFFYADGGAMFGAIPKTSWIRRYSCDEKNRCLLAMRCGLIKDGKRNILVDTGVGSFSDDTNSFYEFHNLTNMYDALKEYDLEPDDITDVILTHLHFDHCGFATYYCKEEDTYKPSFPKANYWVSKTQWESFRNPSELEKPSFDPNTLLPVLNAGRLRLIDRACSIANNIQLYLFDGHTNGQLVPVFESKDQTLIFPGDVIPTLAHLSLEWISAYDIMPLKSYAAKKRLLEYAIEKNATLIFYHDTQIASCSVKKVGEYYKADTISRSVL